MARGSRRKGWARGAVAFAAVAAAVAVGRRYGWDGEAAVAAFRGRRDALGPWAAPAYVAAHALTLALCPPYAILFEGAAALLFGFLPGVACVFSAKVLGASLSFWIGRSCWDEKLISYAILCVQAYFCTLIVEVRLVVEQPEELQLHGKDLERLCLQKVTNNSQNMFPYNSNSPLLVLGKVLTLIFLNLVVHLALFACAVFVRSFIRRSIGISDREQYHPHEVAVVVDANPDILMFCEIDHQYVLDTFFFLVKQRKAIFRLFTSAMDWLKSNKYFHIVVKGVERDGWKFVLLARFSPLPSYIINYALSATDVGFFKDFLLPTVVGCLPMILQNVSIVSLAGAAVASTTGSEKSRIYSYLFPVLGIMSSILISWRIKQYSSALVIPEELKNSSTNGKANVDDKAVSENTNSGETRKRR
uniref:Expressed protein n=1 Tax=Oryza sativa subsp. japonica TaxID=39947 RepID=Q2R353_ORYSJ|nr:expressed protein [Oryza sativa Japonica Group]